MSVTFPGRVEAIINVPSGVSVSASNSGGGATSVSLTEDSYFWTAAGTVSGLAAHIASQLNATRAPSSGEWTCTVSTTTGQLSIGCTGTTAIPSFSLAWTNTTLRDLLGFTRDIDYPSTAAQMATDLGYGTWTSGLGYLCNEASGNLSPVFGSGTLTAGGTPTYSNQGPRGGADKAVSLDLTGSNRFDGGNMLDVSDTDDLAVALVGKFSSAPSGTDILVSKGVATDTGGWAIFRTNSTLIFRYRTGSTSTDITTPAFAGFASGEWFVAIATIDRSTGKACVGVRGLTSGDSAVATETAVSGTLTNSNTFRLGSQTGFGSGVGTAQYAAVYAVKGSSVATGLSANMATALTTYAATFGMRTGTLNPRGLWLPDITVNVETAPKRAPMVSDLRTTQGPTGNVYGLSGNTFLRHRSVVWPHVPKERTWESDATLDYASWEWFFKETQLGLGSSWFDVASLIQVYDHTGTLVGIDANDGTGTDGWSITGVTGIEPKPSIEGSDLRYRIEIPQLVSSG